MHAPAQLGLVVHPRREVEGALATIRDWASANDATVGQVPIAGQSRRVAEPVDAGACDLLLAVGGDGTMLAALHAAAPADRPVLGVACGSIGVLTSVQAEDLSAGLEQVAAGRWTRRTLPALEVAAEGHEPRFAINDFVVIRDGTGQVLLDIEVDGQLYARTAGDGLVVATPLGSTAYTMAAGGPILGPGTTGMVLVPLAHHGGVSPPLVVGPQSRLGLSVETGHGGGRFEIDGQVLATTPAAVTVSHRGEYASVVALADQEPLLARLRRRRLVVDAPRLLARDARDDKALKPPAGAGPPAPGRRTTPR